MDGASPSGCGAGAGALSSEEALDVGAELLPGGNLGVTALMIAIVVPFYNMMSVVVLEYFRGGKPKLGEVLLAVAIIMGIWVRMSALILSLGILLMFAWGGFGAGELEFVWLGVYVFLIISGGGLYAFDTALTPAKPKK